MAAGAWAGISDVVPIFGSSTCAADSISWFICLANFDKIQFGGSSACSSTVIQSASFSGSQELALLACRHLSIVRVEAVICVGNESERQSHIVLGYVF